MISPVFPPAAEQRDAHRLRGRLVVPADGCTYPPAVHPDDLLRVNFDVHALRADGLYLVEIMGKRGVEWRGCKRFARMPMTGAFVDESGRGDWAPVDQANNFRVVGYVEKVYRPVDAGAAI